MEKKLKIGIIGCGGIANGKHMPALKKLPNVEMVAFCDIIVERAEKAAKDFGTEGAKVYADYKEMLADCELVPSELRREIGAYAGTAAAIYALKEKGEI